MRFGTVPHAVTIIIIRKEVQFAITISFYAFVIRHKYNPNVFPFGIISPKSLLAVITIVAAFEGKYFIEMRVRLGIMDLRLSGRHFLLTERAYFFVVIDPIQLAYWAFFHVYFFIGKIKFSKKTPAELFFRSTGV